VKAALLSGMLDLGYRLVRDEAFSITLERQTDNFAANLLLATPAGGPPVVRVTYTVAELGPDVRVVSDMALIQNSGTAFERRNDVSRGADSPRVQAFLDTIAAETAGKKWPQREGIHRVIGPSAVSSAR